MIRALSITVVVGLLAAPALADVTLTSQVTGKGLGKAAESQSITYIKGLKMRTDSTLGDAPKTTIIDVETQKFISIDHQKKEASVIDMAQLRQHLDTSMKGGEAKASLKPNSAKKEIAGRACDGYDISVAMPMALGGDTTMTMVMSGPVFIAKGGPGSADYARFHLAAAEKGFIMSDPRAAKGAPQQTKGMTELYKAIADTGGIPYFMEMNMKVEGGGPMAGMMNKVMGGSAFSNTVTAVSTDAIAAHTFDIPAGYKVKDSK
ncbi:MAG: hypothetical protein JJE40_04180 [Vicinamibacteria bacterium]|nr:hypothetical protein [Vicinamibacteria bacterium]